MHEKSHTAFGSHTKIVDIIEDACDFGLLYVVRRAKPADHLSLVCHPWIERVKVFSRGKAFGGRVVLAGNNRRDRQISIATP